MTPCICRFVMTGRILLATLGLCWIAGLADCAEPPGLLFRLSFDKQTVTADVAAGQGHPQSQTTAKDFRFTDGVKGKAQHCKGTRQWPSSSSGSTFRRACRQL